ncbi:hypothetical protein [Streptomyces sp. NPDC014006]|uniref:hypothetical protein n=1 Tax=Streptomyces sp. NPDC014006 TaxID=3364870 RepID=UPI0036FA4BCE
MRKAMRLPGLMLASLALVGASATAASASGQFGADRPGQQARGADEGNKCGNGTKTTDGDAQVTVICGADHVTIHNEQGITPSLATAIIGGIGGIVGGGG